MQRAVTLQGYRELAGITNEAAAIGPPPSRQAGMSDAFAASVRALELADEAALVKAMGRGELVAQVREYERAEAVAPADVRAQIDLSDSARQRYADRAEKDRQAGNEALARSNEAVAQRMDTTRARAQAEMAAISRSEFDDNLARAQAGAEQLAAQRARDQAERDRAAVDEPVIRAEAETQAELEAAAAANPNDHAETDDVELEI